MDATARYGMTTIRLPKSLPTPALRRLAEELTTAAKLATMEADQQDREAVETAARRARLRAALEARRTAATRRRAALLAAILHAAPAASVARSQGVSVRTVERARADLAAQLRLPPLPPRE